MTIATTSATARRSLLRHIPDLALALAGAALVLLALAPIGWRAGWWHFRFSLLTLMPWAAYFGLAAVIVSVLTLAIGLSRLDRRGIEFALVALIGGGLIAYVPWHYDQIRQAVPPIHDITTDTNSPPAFVAVVPLRQVRHQSGRLRRRQDCRTTATSLPRYRTTDCRAGARCRIWTSARYRRANGLDDCCVRQVIRPDRGEPKESLDGVYRRYRRPRHAGRRGQPRRPTLVIALWAQ